MKGQLFIRAICLVFLTSATGAMANGIQYTVTPLGSLGGTTYACGINASGQVVGQSNGNGFLYSGGVMENVNKWTGEPPMTSASAISDNGLVVGSGTSMGSGLAMCCDGDDGLIAVLGTLPTNGLHAWPNSSASGVNASGQIVGISSTGASSGYNYHAFLSNGSTMQDLGTLAGDVSSGAEAINASGQVVGYSANSSVVKHAFLYSGGVMQGLGSLPGRPMSDASAINASAQVVGCSYTSTPGDGHAFLYSGGSMYDLGTLPGGTTSAACGINASGQVVGYASTSSGQHAFLYSGGAMQDLNSLIDSTLGCTLKSAVAINDVGQIAVNGTDSLGHTEAFLLTPVPEPATMSLLGLAGLAMLRRKRK